ncbi:tRNA (adenosine(37)-N6)-threonylcarbamoyltransferase complex dimerization subunit type 1 TsaB [Erythrobacter insulae]|uniref:tRNA (Adenosine(37)-N6)-threonylcarbamoyltransferase complex dimerization subunit type 1 TsaB n=1 Tax=Erythrobacter insulae TaxID=2584124 RepID=A0A547PDR6_9SPHN|nr:tRNA (adenosine(37)-N6)-threonylcarbamoyltransferase complex dimerization subunit type 1 TsaB [Erythrobacter insulae]TRD12269.1 tRNA (adenosine(37)-N6)-threonylcarbamoyltransferase complex dimerization subunit type 1 TsaB [Erythrobacter insulae]
MRTLAIETATEACSIALFEGDDMIAHDHRVLGRGHAERLVPMIAELPDKGRAERILVSLGPGSFTGVRIGIATARALGFAWNAKVRGYPTLSLIAARACQLSARGVTVCMNGGHGEWFIQNFAADLSSDTVRSLSPDAASEAALYGVLAGNRANELAQKFGDDRAVLDLLPDSQWTPGLPETHLTADLSPIYGRAPDATPQKARPAP